MKKMLLTTVACLSFSQAAHAPLVIQPTFVAPQPVYAAPAPVVVGDPYPSEYYLRHHRGDWRAHDHFEHVHGAYRR